MAKRLRSEGYRPSHISEALGISRSVLYRRKRNGKKKRSLRPQDEELKRRIDELVMAHPYWGYRRIWAWLRKREGLRINKKRVYRLMQESGRLLKKKRRKPKRVYRSKPAPERPGQIWGIDMSKFFTLRQGWANMVVVLDWWSRKIVAAEVDKSAKTELWLKALEGAVFREFPEGVSGRGLSLVSDNGSQPTSRKFMEAARLLNIKQIFTSYDNPKGNAETERMIRTIKEEVIWPFEYETVDEAKEALSRFVERYNRYYPHSALGYLSPLEAEERYYKIKEGKDGHSTNFTQKVSTF